SAAVERRSDGRYRLRGEAHSVLGTWPYEILVEHEEGAERRVASWEGGRGSVQVLRGSWTLTPAGAGRTLLVYASHVEVKRLPDWLVANALLLRQPKVIRAVADRLPGPQAQPPGRRGGGQTPRGAGRVQGRRFYPQGSRRAKGGGLASVGEHLYNGRAASLRRGPEWNATSASTATSTSRPVRTPGWRRSSFRTPP